MIVGMVINLCFHMMIDLVTQSIIQKMFVEKTLHEKMSKAAEYCKKDITTCFKRELILKNESEREIFKQLIEIK